MITTESRLAVDYDRLTPDQLKCRLRQLEQDFSDVVAMRVAKVKSSIRSRIASDFAALNHTARSGEPISPDSWECLAYKLREELNIQEVV
jgi:hypothetical protein